MQRRYGLFLAYMTIVVVAVGLSIGSSGAWFTSQQSVQVTLHFNVPQPPPTQVPPAEQSTPRSPIVVAPAPQITTPVVPTPPQVVIPAPQPQPQLSDPSITAPTNDSSDAPPSPDDGSADTAEPSSTSTQGDASDLNN